MAGKPGLIVGPGRPRRHEAQKVERKSTAALLPLPVREACERAAEEGGYGSLSDYLVSVLAPAVGLPEHAPKPKYPDYSPSQELLVS